MPRPQQIQRREASLTNISTNEEYSIGGYNISAQEMLDIVECVRRDKAVSIQERFNYTYEVISTDANGAVSYSTREDKNTTLLHIAAIEGHIKVAEEIFKTTAGLELINAENIHSQTPLHKAASMDKLVIVQTLVEHGANIEATDKQGRTPLHEACLRGHRIISGFLINRGARVNAKDNYERTPLHNAESCNNLGLIRFLVDHSATVNEETKDGDTALHNAASNGDLESVKYLVERGNAKINARNKQDYTPLFEALYNSHQAADYLKSKDASLSEKEEKDLIDGVKIQAWYNNTPSTTLENDEIRVENNKGVGAYRL